MQPDRVYLVLTAVGPDRPGLVSEIARAVRECDGNLEDSRMAILGGEFALILLASGTAQALQRLRQRAPELEQHLNLQLLLRDTSRSEAQRGFIPYRLRVTGLDRPGIVHSVTELLAKQGVNVASLESRLTFAPLSGTPMFVLEAALQVPSEIAFAKLRREMSARCDEENLDFVLDAALD